MSRYVSYQLRIEVGYGLEGTLTDALSKIIIVNDGKPVENVGASGRGGSIVKIVAPAVVVLFVVGAVDLAQAVVAAARLVGTPWRLNAQVAGAWLRSPIGAPLAGATAGIDRALERGGITMRGYDRILRLAWTLCDLDGAARPDGEHVGRALYLRKAAR